MRTVVTRLRLTRPDEALREADAVAVLPVLAALLHRPRLLAHELRRCTRPARHFWSAKYWQPQANDAALANGNGDDDDHGGDGTHR